MKSRSKESSKKSLRFNASQMKDALKWVDQLTQKEKNKLEQLGRIKLAQMLMEEYLKRRNKISKRKSSYKKN